MSRFSNFGLLNTLGSLGLNSAVGVISTGTVGAGLLGLGYAASKPLMSDEEFSVDNLGKEVAANTVGGLVSSAGVYYGGNLLNKIRLANPKFKMHYMSANFKFRC